MRADEINPDYVYENDSPEGDVSPQAVDSETKSIQRNIAIDAEWDDSVGIISLQMYNIDEGTGVIIFNIIYYI